MDNLSYIAIGGGILLLVIVIILVIVCTKKKSNSRYDSEESMESYTSETDWKQQRTIFHRSSSSSSRFVLSLIDIKRIQSVRNKCTPRIIII